METSSRVALLDLRQTEAVVNRNATGLLNGKRARQRRMFRLQRPEKGKARCLESRNNTKPCAAVRIDSRLFTCFFCFFLPKDPNSSHILFLGLLLQLSTGFDEAAPLCILFYSHYIIVEKLSCFDISDTINPFGLRVVTSQTFSKTLITYTHSFVCRIQK